MVWFVRLSLIATFAFLIGGIRWMTIGSRVSNRNHRLTVVLSIWAIALAVVIALGAYYVWNDGMSFLLAGLNAVVGLPCTLAVIAVYFTHVRRSRR